MAALDPHPGPQQRGIQVLTGRPDPPDVTGPLTRRHHGWKIFMPNDGPVARPVPRGLGQPATTLRPGDDSNPHT